MEAANEAGGADRASDVKNLDAETSLAPCTESKLGKPCPLSDHKPQGCVSNVVDDLPRLNKGGVVRGEQTIKMWHHFYREDSIFI